MSRGLLIVVSAPSGCGKGTILAEVLKNDNYYYSISATTRSPREGEKDGINYHFLSKTQFEELISNNGMLEYASYCDNYYGTPKKQVDEMLENGKDVILEIEVQGAMKIRETCPDAVFVFILPPSIPELRRRLYKRGTEQEDIINKRVSKAKDEISFADKYDYVITNGELDKAVTDFLTVINAEKFRVTRSKKIIDEVLNYDNA
ncbi:MAG: guanylate kinase [Oscillospiraceae bacterium]